MAPADPWAVGGFLMKTSMISLLLVASLTSSAGAVDGQIVIAFDAGGGTCSAVVPCNCQQNIYVLGLLEGASVGGITGAEYSVQIGPNNSPDPGWLFSETFDPAALVIGGGAFNPPDNAARGVNVAWPGCQQGTGRHVLLETVRALNFGCAAIGPQLLVVKHSRPSNQFFQCPLFVLCDAPVYTKVCVGFTSQCQNPEPPFPNNATCSTGGQGFLNPVQTCNFQIQPEPADCTIAVDAKSWSRVKGLYRN